MSEDVAKAGELLSPQLKFKGEIQTCSIESLHASAMHPRYSPSTSSQTFLKLCWTQRWESYTKTCSLENFFEKTNEMEVFLEGAFRVWGIKSPQWTWIVGLPQELELAFTIICREHRKFLPFAEEKIVVRWTGHIRVFNYQDMRIVGYWPFKARTNRCGCSQDKKHI